MMPGKRRYRHTVMYGVCIFFVFYQWEFTYANYQDSNNEQELLFTLLFYRTLDNNAELNDGCSTSE